MTFFETPIRDLMSRNISTVDAHMSVHDALERMRKLKITHLPVKAAGKTVGILSERDLAYISTLKDSNPQHVHVLDVMISDPIFLDEETPLNKVARTMLKNNIGCILVTNKKTDLVGIFTTHDALRMISES